VSDLQFLQVFLTFCTLVTLYFAKEVPLNANASQHLSDSAPLLNDSQGTCIDFSKSNPNGNSSPAYTMNGESIDKRMNQESRNEENQGQDFNDAPGAVMVKLLTSLRHLPPAMHSVLIVTTLTWVRLS